MDNIEEIMVSVREWLALPLAQAKAAMRAYLDAEGGYSKLDYDLLAHSESTEEAIGLVFGI